MLMLKNKKEETEINQVLNKNSRKSGKLTPMLLNSERNKNFSRGLEESNLIDKNKIPLCEENISTKSNKKSSNLNTLSGKTRKIEDTHNEKIFLDDPKFRKSFIKNEKIEIDCESNNNSVMSRSMIKFDDDYTENYSKPLEDKFNKIVRDQLIHEYYEVNDFLESLNLKKHVEIFIKNGYVSQDKIING